MYSKQILFSIFLFLISTSVYPHTKVFPGYYIDLKGDSVHCNVDFNDWNMNPNIIRVQVNSSWKEFSPEEIKGFGVYGYDDFTSARVSFHTNPISGKDFPENFSDSMD